MRNIPLKIEIVGMLLVLLAVGWEIFVEGNAREISHRISFNKTEKKVYDIGAYIAWEAYQKSENYAKPNIAINHDEYLKRVNEWELPGLRESLKEQLDSFTLIRGLLFLAGSFFIIFGKYRKERGIGRE